MDLESIEITKNTLGGLVPYTLTLAKNGTKNPWFSITVTAKNGIDTVNKFGGYNPRNVGEEKYIMRIWKSLKKESN